MRETSKDLDIHFNQTRKEPALNAHSKLQTLNTTRRSRRTMWTSIFYNLGVDVQSRLDRVWLYQIQSPQIVSCPSTLLGFQFGFTFNPNSTHQLWIKPYPTSFMPLTSRSILLCQLLFSSTLSPFTCLTLIFPQDCSRLRLSRRASLSSSLKTFLTLIFPQDCRLGHEANQ